MTGGARNLEVIADQGDRDAWLAARMDGLGGSDVSAIIGENPHRTAIDVWRARVRGEVADVYSERSLVGQVLEPVVLGMFVQGVPMWVDGGNRTAWRPPMVARRDRPWHRGSADALVRDDGGGRYVTELAAFSVDDPWDGGAEVKTHGWAAYRQAYDNPDDPIPADKKTQIAWYAELYGIRRWDLIALVDTHLRKQWTYWHDPAFGADLLTIAETWWKRHIVGGVEPDPDGTERWNAYLADRFPKSVERVVVAAPALDAVCAQLVAAKAREKAAEAEVERLTQQIKASMGDAAVLETTSGRFTWRAQRGRVRHGEVVAELASRLELTPTAIAEVEDRHRGDDFRVFNCPRTRNS